MSMPLLGNLRDRKDRLNRSAGRLPGARHGKYRPDNSHPHQPTVAPGRKVGARPTDGKGAHGMAVVTMRQLLEAGVHFGHQTRRWDPRMRRFIHGERSGIYIIDLQQTLDRIEGAYTFTRDMAARGGMVLFVGTKRQAQSSVQSFAEKCGMPYVNQRWLGGMLTNFKTISKRVGKMQEYQRMRDSGEFEAMPKKEALMLSRELEKLERNLTGIKDMDRLPDAIFVVDTIREHIAVAEANKLGIPVVAVVDTDCNPDLVQHLIPGNDDAIRSSHLMCRVIADAVDEHHRHAAVLQHREARALLIDRRDDDALHPRLHQQVEVVAFPHGVVAAVAEDHTGAELGAALLGAECDVDEERVVEVGDREPERAHPTGSELPRPLAGHEVEFADRREYAFAGLGVDVRRSVEDIADRAGGDASEGGDVFDGRHHSPSFGDSFNEPVYGSESGVGRSRRRRGPGNTAATRPD